MLIPLVTGCGGGAQIGFGTFGAPTSQSGIGAADLNGDGLTDVAVAVSRVSGPSPRPGFVRVYLQTPSRVFAAPVEYAVGTDPRGLAIADVDGDGRLDIVVANTTSGDVAILTQDRFAPGTFQSAQRVSVGGSPYGIAVADINIDGRRDIAAALQNAGGGAAVLLQDRVRPMVFQSPLQLLNGGGATSVAIGDLDNNGRPDVAINGATAAVFFQDPLSVSFAPGVQLVSGIRPAAVAVADVDGDRLDDLLVLNEGNPADGSNASLAVFRQDVARPGNFLPPASSSVANGARQLELGRLGIGVLPDVAVISRVDSPNLPSRLTVLRQQPIQPGVFQPGQILVGPPESDFLAIGDVNADGAVDIVVNDGPQVFLQNSTAPGTFQAVRRLP